ncbi:hypothetical protein [Clostridium neonatale]|uniref:hypothetical protein n=1 Tax=Clostridium neonatale TaxID=137838 RepID=UPI00291B9FEA|nr:hypothetical protein [Clostridium neonatale]CAI3557202.1 conserved hypothetical protein [Clostridium neonatale]CAI3566209.1 conserved hypothetical protein [Clostridium neonatale]
MNDLFERFKKKYEANTDMKVKKGKIIKGILTVKVFDTNDKYLFWLHVVENNGIIEWY